MQNNFKRKQIKVHEKELKYVLLIFKKTKTTFCFKITKGAF